MLIRGQEVLLPTSMVGNYPNPLWFNAYVARQWTGDQLPPGSLEREAFEDAILALAHDQEEAGLDIISDGRLQGDNYIDQAVYYYHRRLGYEFHGPYLGLPVYSAHFAPTLTQEIKRRGPIMVEQARALKKATKKPVKIQYTSIQVLAQATNDLFYSNSRDRALAIAKAINEDVLELDAMGVDFIQMDEFTWPYFFEEWAIEAFNRAVEGVKNAKIVCHICWGNWAGTPGYFPDETAKPGEIFDLTRRKAPESGSAHKVIPKAYEARMDVLNLETAGRRRDDLSGLDVLKEHPLPKNLQFWAGVIDVKTVTVETVEEVADRIRKIMQYVPPEHLGVTTDCGLIQLPRYAAFDKLRALAGGAQIVREELRQMMAA